MSLNSSTDGLVRTSSQLTREQIEALQAKLRPMLAWLSKLGGRMDHNSWLPDDKLQLLTCTARDALHDLNCERHEMTCSGVGRKPRAR